MYSIIFARHCQYVGEAVEYPVPTYFRIYACARRMCARGRERFFKKLSKTPLTKEEKGDILHKPLDGGDAFRELGSKNLKKLEKSFKKVLTNGKKEGIIVKLSGEEMRRAGIGL